jgi:uncharacterized membrane protein
MFQAPEPSSRAAKSKSAEQPASDAREVTPTVPLPNGRRWPELSEAERLAARQVLGAVFIAAGIAHLTHQRFYRTVLPYWLLEARREIEVVTGGVEVFGGVLMFVSPLRKVARWTNLAVLTPALIAAIREARRPSSLGPFSQHREGLNAIGPLALAPVHASLAGVLWWATEHGRRRSRPIHLAEFPAGRG